VREVAGAEVPRDRQTERIEALGAVRGGARRFAAGSQSRRSLAGRPPRRATPYGTFASERPSSSSSGRNAASRPHPIALPRGPPIRRRPPRRQPAREVEREVGADRRARDPRHLRRVEGRGVLLGRLESRDPLLESREDALGPPEHPRRVRVRAQKEGRLVQADQPLCVADDEAGGGGEQRFRRGRSRARVAGRLQALEQGVDATRHGAHATSI
jgi:hypothetical protein